MSGARVAITCNLRGNVVAGGGGTSWAKDPARMNHEEKSVARQRWEETNPAEDIARGVIGGLEGHSMDRHRGWDHDRRYRDRDGNRDRDNDDVD